MRLVINVMRRSHSVIITKGEKIFIILEIIFRTDLSLSSAVKLIKPSISYTFYQKKEKKITKLVIHNENIMNNALQID